MNSEDKGVPIRVPATANLMLDSADRNETVNPNPFDFSISRPNSLLNGFFTRIGTTEVVLEWSEPNANFLVNTGIPVRYLSTGGTSVSTIVQPFTGNFYTAEQGLSSFTALLNQQFSTNAFSLSASNGYVAVSVSNGSLGVSTSTESVALGLATANNLNVVFPSIPVVSPDLRPYRYIDFTSQQLTYNQDLKDSSTAPLVKDVLCRWYFDWDTPPQLDGLGFPIDMGYTPFRVRRIYNPPKQIKWDPRQPLGQLAFQAYGDNEQSVVPVSNASIRNSTKTNWLMTLQVSEA